MTGLRLEYRDVSVVKLFGGFMHAAKKLRFVNVCSRWHGKEDAREANRLATSSYFGR